MPINCSGRDNILIMGRPIGGAVRIAEECVPCLKQRVGFELDLIDPGAKREVIPRVAVELERALRSGKNSAHTATRVHRLAYTALGCDPYADLKRRATEVAHSLLPEARSYIASSPDTLRSMVLVSIVGNALDFGISSSLDAPESLVREFGRLIRSPFVDGTAELRRSVMSCGRILYFTDNCGEVVMDRFLLEWLRERTDVHIVAKSSPVLTDATVEDVLAAGLDALAVEVHGSGGFAVGFDPDALPGKVRSFMRMRDTLILCKGMANYEVISDLRCPAAVFVLMRSKCGPVSRSLGVPQGANVCVRLPSSGG